MWYNTTYSACQDKEEEIRCQMMGSMGVGGGKMLWIIFRPPRGIGVYITFFKFLLIHQKLVLSIQFLKEYRIVFALLYYIYSAIFEISIFVSNPNYDYSS